MKKVILLCILLISGLVAEEKKPKGYVSVDFANLLFQSTGVNKNFSLKGTKWTAGYALKGFKIPFTEIEINSAVEGSFLSGTGSDTQDNAIGVISDVNYGEVTSSLGYIYAMYLKTPLSIGERLDFNLYLGASQSEVTMRNENFDKFTNSNTSISYGLGVEYMLPKNISTHVGFFQYFNNLSSIEFGLGVKF